jgi:poly(hydroxyalkanoate) depolymerase family esterase
MKNPFNARAPTFDANAIQATIQRALASAGFDTTVGPMHDVTETIRRALGAGRAPEASPSADSQSVIDVSARDVPAGDHKNATRERELLAQQAKPQSGTFEAHTFSNEAGTRTYKVYVPAGESDTPRPLIVMLHGCTQSADDFAAGTQMNRLADEHGFLVVYPEQAAQANASKCWNWFNPQDQLRGAGEPSLIAGIVGDVARKHGADTGRIFVAGLSAGAAMAVVLGETYPELFAGVGAHSGLPYGSAHDIPSALAAMKGGRSAMAGLKGVPGATTAPRRKLVHAVPVIVFHGDRDHTVQQTNGAHIAQQACNAHSAQAGDTALRVSKQSGVALGGQKFSRTVHADADGQARIESWTLHGAGHAWSGGHASGSFTDGSGVDASTEMVRFFLSLPSARTF